MRKRHITKLEPPPGVKPIVTYPTLPKWLVDKMAEQRRAKLEQQAKNAAKGRLW